MNEEYKDEGREIREKRGVWQGKKVRIDRKTRGRRESRRTRRARISDPTTYESNPSDSKKRETTNRWDTRFRERNSPMVSRQRAASCGSSNSRAYRCECVRQKRERKS